MNRFLRRFAWLLAAAGLWLLSAGGLEGGLGAWMIDRPQEERMKNVVLASSSAQQPTGSTVTTTLPRLLSAARGEAALFVPPETDAVWETAIEGGVRKVFVIDGRVPHSILIEMLTDEGIGTMFY